MNRCFLKILFLALPLSGFSADFTVINRTIEDWRPFAGRVESRAVKTVIAPSGGPNIVLDIAQEGKSVEKGEVIVRFSVDRLEGSRQRAQSDLAIAKAAYSEAKDGRQPLERATIQSAIEEARLERQRYEAELAELRQIKELGLVAQSEIDRVIQQREAAERTQRAKERELDLITTTLQPAELKRLSTEVERSEQELAQINLQIEQSIIKAEQNGVVELLPIFIAGQQRTARAGDEISQGRAFMQIVDVSDIQVHLDINESQSAGVRVGNKTKVYPIADKRQYVDGTVIMRGQVAKSNPNSSERTIDTIIKVDKTLDLLVPGASVEANILVNNVQDAVAIPRGAVQWKEGQPMVEMNGSLVPVNLGLTDALWVEVVSGLNKGDIIQTP